MAASVVFRLGQITIRISHLVYICLIGAFVMFSFLYVLPKPEGIIRRNSIVKNGPIRSERELTLQGSTVRATIATVKTVLTVPSVNMSHFQMLQEKVNQLAALLKQKSVQVKTKLEDIGLISKVYKANSKIVAPLSKRVWNISEIAVKELVSDKAYFHLLQEAVNKTRAISLKYRPVFDLTAGTCDCVYTYCECCARVFAKRLHINHKTCVNFTYAAGKQDLTVKIDVNDQPSFNKTVSGQDPPVICLGGTTQICTQFLNVTYSVKALESSHQTTLAGCLEYHLNVVNKTIASYPVGCFQSDTKKSKKGEFVQYLRNWIV